MPSLTTWTPMRSRPRSEANVTLGEDLPSSSTGGEDAVAAVQHISMRVPWRDQPWDDRIARVRRQQFVPPAEEHRRAARRRLEMAHAGKSIAELTDVSRLACLTERGPSCLRTATNLRRSTPTASRRR